MRTPAHQGLRLRLCNILAVKGRAQGHRCAVKALKAALESQQVVDYINEKYDGSRGVRGHRSPDGYDASVNYDALNGTISIAASPAPKF